MEKTTKIRTSTVRYHQQSRTICLYLYRYKGKHKQTFHSDYLNNKMKSIRKRHKELAHATPHKLRHTGATAGTSIEAISEALTHSETGTTQIYVNTSNVIPMAVGEIAYRNLKK